MSSLAQPWLEAGGALLLTLCGVLTGWWFSRLKAPWWLLGYVIPLGAILVYGLSLHHPRLTATFPLTRWLEGRAQFALVGLLSALVLVTPLSRIGRKQARVLILVLLGLIAWSMSIWPFLAPAFNRSRLAALETKIDHDGICLQNTEYTCGPAAAVTALRRLGFEAEEGQIAIDAHTSTAIGTPPHLLANALNARYGPKGLVAEARVFRSMDELRQAGLTLAIIKFSFMLDHYVAVLEIEEDQVVLGDPLNGLTRWSDEKFKKRWRYVGVTLRRAESSEPE